MTELLRDLVLRGYRVVLTCYEQDGEPYTVAQVGRDGTTCTIGDMDCMRALTLAAERARRLREVTP